MYLLDAMVIIYFKATGQLSALVRAAETASLVVAQEVYDEVVTRNTTDGVLVKQQLAASRVEVRPLPLSNKHVLASLRSGRGPGAAGNTADLGEDVSIVLALTDKDLVFVTSDKKAAFYALGELREARGRVMTLHVFLHALVEQGALQPEVAKKVASKVHSAPSWWASWANRKS
jgi:hypothetical protein